MDDGRQYRDVLKPSGLRILGCSQVMMGILPVAQLAVGAVYQHDCPTQPYIPIYLMVMGVASLVLCGLSLRPYWSSVGTFSIALKGLVSLFGFCWFIAGNVWIYSIYEPNYNNTITIADTYCNKTLYLFAFWTTNLFYILMAFNLLCGCCSCLCGSDET